MARFSFNKKTFSIDFIKQLWFVDLIGFTVLMSMPRIIFKELDLISIKYIFIIYSDHLDLNSHDI